MTSRTAVAPLTHVLLALHTYAPQPTRLHVQARNLSLMCTSSSAAAHAVLDPPLLPRPLGCFVYGNRVHGARALDQDEVFYTAWQGSSRVCDPSVVAGREHGGTCTDDRRRERNPGTRCPSMDLELVPCHVPCCIHGDDEKLDRGVHSLDMICQRQSTFRHLKTPISVTTPADWRVAVVHSPPSRRTLNTSTWLRWTPPPFHATIHRPPKRLSVPVE